LSLKTVDALVGVPEGLQRSRVRPSRLQSVPRVNEQAKMKTTRYQEKEMKQEQFAVWLADGDGKFVERAGSDEALDGGKNTVCSAIKSVMI
jgi:hypothetical protein